MKRHINGFKQFLNECGCAGGGTLPEAGDYGMNQDGTSIHDETGAMVTEEDESTNEIVGGPKKITITANDSEGNLEKMLNLIKELGNSGHSFSIVIDPDSDNEETFSWDGDGSDKIDSIESESTEEEEESEEGSDDDSEPDHDEDDSDNDDSESEDEEEDEDLNEAKKEKKRAGSEADGSYPITDLKSLKAAIHAYGRSKDKAKTKAHIKSRAKALGLTKHVSDEWK